MRKLIISRSAADKKAKRKELTLDQVARLDQTALVLLAKEMQGAAAYAAQQKRIEEMPKAETLDEAMKLVADYLNQERGGNDQTTPLD